MRAVREPVLVDPEPFLRPKLPARIAVGVRHARRRGQQKLLAAVEQHLAQQHQTAGIRLGVVDCVMGVGIAKVAVDIDPGKGVGGQDSPRVCAGATDPPSLRQRGNIERLSENRHRGIARIQSAGVGILVTLPRCAAFFKREVQPGKDDIDAAAVLIRQIGVGIRDGVFVVAGLESADAVAGVAVAIEGEIRRDPTLGQQMKLHGRQMPPYIERLFVELNTMG